MKKIEYTCDKCGLLIDGKTTPVKGNLHGVGDTELITIERTNGGWAHNGIPNNGWHFHHVCFSSISKSINEHLKL